MKEGEGGPVVGEGVCTCAGIKYNAIKHEIFQSSKIF